MENKKIIKENECIEFYNSRRYEANCFNEDGSLNKNYNFFKSTGLIASIFEDHWKEVYFKNKKIIDYLRPNAPIEAVLQFEQEDEWNGLPISTPPYTICSKCNFDKCVPIDYVSKRGFHHLFKDN